MCHHGRCRSASLVYFLLRASDKSPRKEKAGMTMAKATARVVPAYRESCEKYLYPTKWTKKLQGMDLRLTESGSQRAEGYAYTHAKKGPPPDQELSDPPLALCDNPHLKRDHAIP